MVIRAGIHKLFVKIANREDPDKTASSEAVWSECVLCGRQLVFKILDLQVFLSLWNRQSHHL